MWRWKVSGGPVLRVTTVLALGMLAACAGRVAEIEAPSVNGPWQVVEVEGPVEARSPGANAWGIVLGATSIPAGSELRTADGGRVAIGNGGDVLRLASATEVRLPDDASPAVRHTAGDVSFDIESVPDRQFEIETPYLLLTVKGTEFDVTVSDVGTEVSVDEGVVQVDDRSGRYTADVRPGHRARIAANPDAPLEASPAPGEKPVAVAARPAREQARGRPTGSVRASTPGRDRDAASAATSSTSGSGKSDDGDAGSKGSGSKGGGSKGGGSKGGGSKGGGSKGGNDDNDDGGGKTKTKSKGKKDKGKDKGKNKGKAKGGDDD